MVGCLAVLLGQKNTPKNVVVARWLEGTDARESYDANPYASPSDHSSAARILRSGQRAGAVPAIDPAPQRGPRNSKTVEDRSRIGALLYVQSFVAGVGRSSAIRE